MKSTFGVWCAFPFCGRAICLILLLGRGACADTIVFFDASQTTNLVASGATFDTWDCNGYLFTFTRDKLFTGGVGLTNPVGRYVRVPWPNGLEAQAVTAGPSPGNARIDVKRSDGQPFSIQTFSARLLANTAGAGAAFEIMPKRNGEDGVPDPFTYNATGFAGSQFTYSTPELSGFDAYKLTLYVDFALMSMVIVDADPPRPRIEVSTSGGRFVRLSWPASAVDYTLQFSTNLPPQTWTAITNGIASDGTVRTVEIEAIASQQFFRLKK